MNKMSNINIDYETLNYLENQNLSYEEMINTLGLRISKSFLARKFKEFNIKHKTKYERLEQQVLATEGSVRFLARKFNVSPNTIQKIKQKDKIKMTTLEIIETKSTTTFNVIGHSNYAPYGKDIVCASISTLLISMINVCNFNNMVNSYCVDNGYCKVVLKNRGKNQKQLIYIFTQMFKDIECNYPKNFQIKKND